tara:strand:+ start:353 stop:601 length:249 start_codon:yes stop_codon:yes gene_type:complete
MITDIETPLDIVGGGTIASTRAFKKREAMTANRQTNGDRMTAFEAVVAWSYGCMIDRFETPRETARQEKRRLENSHPMPFGY